MVPLALDAQSLDLPGVQTSGLPLLQELAQNLEVGHVLEPRDLDGQRKAVYWEHLVWR